jgi:hypothetical protein
MYVVGFFLSELALWQFILIGQKAENISDIWHSIFFTFYFSPFPLPLLFDF